MSDDTKQPVNRRDFLTIASSTAATMVASGLTGGLAQAQDSPTTSSTKYKNKTVFITGGARGIGLSTARLFAENGANVVIYDIACTTINGVGYPIASEEDLKNAKSEIEETGAKCLAIKGDVRSRELLSMAVSETVKTFGSLDFLVANAGVTQIGDIAEFTEEEVAAILDINVSGIIKTTQAAVPIMRKQKYGRVVYISSGLGRRGHRDYSVYCASKWAVIGYAKSAAHALGKDNITCNVVCPGLVDTKLANNKYVLERWLPHSPSWSSIEKLLKENNLIPIGPYKPSDIAQVVELFCGPSMSTVTGEVFDINQGASAESIA